MKHSYILALFTRNLVRFIDTEAIVSEVIKLEEYECKWTAKTRYRSSDNVISPSISCFTVDLHSYSSNLIDST